jgi:hypothetical protein
MMMVHGGVDGAQSWNGASYRARREENAGAPEKYLLGSLLRDHALYAEGH